MNRTSLTHPFAVDILERRDCPRSGGTRSHYIGMQLFQSRKQAEAYAHDDPGNVIFCRVRLARAGDREFA